MQHSHLYSVKHALLHGALVSFVIQGAGAGITFMSEVLMARYLGAAGYGLFAMVLAWMQVASMPVLLGSNHLLLRYVPTYVVKEEWSLLRGLLRNSIYVALSMSLIVFGASLLLSDLLDLSNDVRASLTVGMTILPFIALSLQRQAILRGLHKIASALSPEHLIRPIVLICLASAWAFWVDVPLSAPGALTIYGFAVIVAFCIGWYWQVTAAPLEMKSVQAEAQPREWFRAAIPMFLIASMQLLITRIDIMMLGAMVDHEQTGIYAAASRVSDLVIFALASANTIAAPMIAGLYARNDTIGLQHMMIVLAKGVLVVTIPLVIIIVAFGHSILASFGTGYHLGYISLVILVVGQMINALCGPVGYIMVMTGHQKQSLYILAYITVLNFALNLSLIPLYGIEGAAIATAVTIAMWNILMLRYVRRHLGLDASLLALIGKRS
jgi:O-antigen/teichoic acid export membrane protein